MNWDNGLAPKKELITEDAVLEFIRSVGENTS